MLLPRDIDFGQSNNLLAKVKIRLLKNRRTCGFVNVSHQTLPQPCNSEQGND